MYYSKHAQSPQRWHTPQIIEDLKVRSWMFLRKTMNNNRNCITTLFVCAGESPGRRPVEHVPASSQWSQSIGLRLHRRGDRTLPFCSRGLQLPGPRQRSCSSKPFCKLFLSHSSLFHNKLGFLGLATGQLSAQIEPVWCFSVRAGMEKSVFIFHMWLMAIGRKCLVCRQTQGIWRCCTCLAVRSRRRHGWNLC